MNVHGFPAGRILYAIDELARQCFCERRVGSVPTGSQHDDGLDRSAGCCGMLELARQLGISWWHVALTLLNAALSGQRAR